MSERFSVVEGALGRKKSLEERLKDQPEMRAKLESLLELVENAAGDVEEAAEAERRVTEELRQMGNEVLHGWARRQTQKKEEEISRQPGVQRKVKKTSISTRGTERSKWRNKFSGEDELGKRFALFVSRQRFDAGNILRFLPWQFYTKVV